MADLKDLTYRISYDINNSGLDKTTKTEADIDKMFQSIGASVNKVDSNIGKMANSANKANSSTKGVAEALSQTIINAQKASKNAEGISSNLNKAKTNANSVTEAFKNIQNHSTKASTETKTLGKSFDNLNSKAKSFSGTLLQIAGVGGVMGTIGKSLSTFSNFGTAEANLRKTALNMSKSEFANFENYFMKEGLKRGVGPTETLKGSYFLSSAGFNNEENKTLTPKLLEFKKVTGENLESLADSVSNAIASMDIKKEDYTKFFDVNTKAAAVFNANELQVLQAMTRGGIAAKQYGTNLTELATQIGELSAANIKGEEAGTAIRNLNLKMFGDWPEEVAKQFNALGIKLTDENGAKRNLTQMLAVIKQTLTQKGYAREIQSAFLGKIFGEENYIAAQKLYDNLGEKHNAYVKEIENSSGSLKKSYDVMSDTIGAKWEDLKANAEYSIIEALTSHKDEIITSIDKMRTWITDNKEDIIKTTTAIADAGKFLMNALQFAVDNKETLLSIAGAYIAIKTAGEITGIFGSLGLIGSAAGTAGATATATATGMGLGSIIAAPAAAIGIDYILRKIDSNYKKSAEESDRRENKVYQSNQNKDSGVLVSGAAGIGIGPGALYKQRGYATGTNNATPGVHLVGENGPELMTFGGGEKVFTANTTASLLNKTANNNFGNVIGNYDEAITDILPKFADYGKDINKNISDGITGGSSKVTGSINTLTTNSGAQLNNFTQGTYAYGTQMINEISQGVTDSQNNLTNVVQSLTEKVVTAFKTGFGIHSPSRVMYQIGDYLMQGLVNGMTSKDMEGFVTNQVGAMVNYATGAVSGNVSDWITAALLATGTDPSWLPGMLKLASYESGNPGTLGTGSATLVNSVGVGGEYATGLMQTLPSTFREFMQPGMNEIMNPVHNAAAAINYIKSRYGSVYNTPLFRGGKYVGYADGTNSATAGVHLVGERGPELVTFGGGEKVFDNNRTNQMFNQSKPYGLSSSGSISVSIGSPQINIDIIVQDSGNPTGTANEVYRVLEEKFPALADKFFSTLRVQKGFVNIQNV